MRLLVVAVLIAGCAGSPAPGPQNVAAEPPAPAPSPAPSAAPPPIGRSDRDAVELAIAAIGEMAEAAAASAGLCADQGDQLFAIAAANREIFVQLGEISSDEARVAALERRRDGLESAMTALFSGLGPCGDHPAVRGALEQLAP